MGRADVKRDGGARRSASAQRQNAAERRAALVARRRRAVGLLVVVLAAGAFLSVHLLGSQPRAGLHTLSKTRPLSYGVGSTTCAFFDKTRATPDFANGTSTAGRNLTTEVRYPTLTKTPTGPRTGVAPARTYGPFPLIVFATGYDLSPADYGPLLDAWVKAGFVVAAPIFPATNPSAVDADGDSSAPEADDINQPTDVAFVTRQLISSSTARSSPCHLLHGLLATSEIALAGQSDGADTVAALAYNPHFASPGLHIRAVGAFSGQELAAGTTDPYAGASGPPLLVTQSATDQCNPPQDSTKLYDDIAGSKKWFLTIEHADHLPPYSGTDPAASSVVAAVTTRFFELELSGEQPGRAFLRLGNAHPSIAKMSSGADAPSLSSLEQVSSVCYDGV